MLDSKHTAHIHGLYMMRGSHCTFYSGGNFDDVLTEQLACELH